MVKNIAIGALSVALVLVGLLYLGQNLSFSGASGTEHSFQENFNAGLTIGEGTVVNKYKCYTSTYNPAAIASSSAPASLAFLTPSATVGDVVVATLGTVTSTDLWSLEAKVTAGSGTTGATTTLYVRPGLLAGVDLSTTTAKVCIVN